MPELPEVESVRRGLAKTIKNRKIKKVDLIYSKLVNGDTDVFIKTIKGQEIINLNRRGKFLYIELGNGETIVSHLRMEGKYSVEEKATKAHKHTELILDLDDGSRVFYDDTRKFGRMQLAKTGAVEDFVKSIASMGPEPNKKDLKIEYFINKLAESKKEIKAWLLDQNNVAGIGNIYADEVLWMSKIHPQTPANKLTKKQAETLRENIIEELKFATTKGGSTVHSFKSLNGKTGQMQNYLHAYGKKGLPCERCGTTMEKIRVAQRGTTFCPNCQQLQ